MALSRALGSSLSLSAAIELEQNRQTKAPCSSAFFPQLKLRAGRNQLKICSHRSDSLNVPSSSSKQPTRRAHPCVTEAAAVVGGRVMEETAWRETQESIETQKDKFVWEQAWYPVGIADEFDKKVPAAVTVLGLPLVVWWDRNAGPAGDWRVFQDLCPHRFAPLSEGRIHESGGIQCSYHGWAFKGDGACTLIPQADPDRPNPCSNPKACARVYHSKVHQGILWVWPQVSHVGAELAPGVVQLAESTPIPTVPQQDDPSFHVVMGQCDLGYGYEFLVENLSDPSHVPVAHHKILGTRDKAGPLAQVVTEIELQGVKGQGGRFTHFKFSPPCMVHAIVVEPRKPTSDPKESMEGKPVFSMGFYCVPISPGKSRLIWAFSFNFLPPVARKLPAWTSHMQQMLVLDSDHYLLHLLERRLAQEGVPQSKAISAYFTPAKADAYMVGCRRWLDEFAGSEVQWPAGVDTRLPPEPSKRELLDRQRNHVRMCKSCRGAQRGMEALRLALQALSFALLAFTILKAAISPTSLPPPLAVAAVLCSVLFAAGSAWLSGFISRSFYFQDYIHALVD